MNRRTAKLLMVTVAGSLLAGCTSNSDMQGIDPKDYYAKHPVENKVETRNTMAMVHFEPRQTRLSGDEMDHLQAQLHGVSPEAADTIMMQMSESDMHNELRKQHLTKFMRSLGFSRASYQYEPSAALARDDVQLNIAYLAVVTPKCPDWRTSPVTTYSNTIQGNFGCSTVTNLGLMVSDPHDLVAGDGKVSPDAERNYKVISDYRSGKASTSTSSQGGSSSSSGSNSGGDPSGSSTSAVAAGTSNMGQ